jgi:hypothetical protein
MHSTACREASAPFEGCSLAENMQTVRKLQDLSIKWRQERAGRNFSRFRAIGRLMRPEGLRNARIRADEPQAATVLAMSSNEWFAFIRCAASEYISRDRTAALGMAVATRTRSSRICWGSPSISVTRKALLRRDFATLSAASSCAAVQPDGAGHLMRTEMAREARARKNDDKVGRVHRSPSLSGIILIRLNTFRGA